MKQVSIGQYYSTTSIIHDIDPRVKIRFTLIAIVLLLFDRTLPLFLLYTLLFAGIVIASNVPLRHIIGGIRPVVILLAVCSLINLFTTPGAPGERIEILFFHVTRAGLIKSGFVFWRIMLIFLISAMLMYTTTPSQLTDGFEKAFHIKGHTAMTITIALRYIGILFAEQDRILKAMQTRGADIKSGNIKSKLGNVKRVAIPLFQNSIDKASELGDAMDARCYLGGKGRTKYRQLKYDRRDYISYILILLLMIASIYIIITF